MRRRTVRNGMGLILAALSLIILASFFHTGVSDLFSFSTGTELRLYSVGMFIAAAIGGYGVVLTVFGLVLTADRRDDATIRIAPLFFMVVCAIALFFYLLVRSLSSPMEEERIQPGTTITI